MPNLEPTGPDGEVVFQEVLQEIQETQPINITADNKYLAFRGLLQAASVPTQASSSQGSGEDVEMVVTQPTSIPIDPITKKEIEFALKNKKCKHVYDRSAFFEYLKARKPRCPIMGCNNRTTLTEESVEDDIETNALIQRLKATRR